MSRFALSDRVNLVYFMQLGKENPTFVRMSYEKKNRKFISKPVFEGGETALKQFIAKHLTYPKEHIEDQISGVVEVNIDINSKGKIIGSKILKSLGKAFDKEAKRVVELLRFNVPGSGGRSGKVVFHRKMKIHFQAPKKVVKNTNTALQYQITQSNKKQGDPTTSSESKKQGYQYTIRF